MSSSGTGFITVEWASDLIGKAVNYMYKPVDELARVLLSFKRPTRPHRTVTVLIISNFHLENRYAKCFFSQSSKPNELIY